MPGRFEKTSKKPLDTRDTSLDNEGMQANDLTTDAEIKEVQCLMHMGIYSYVDKSQRIVLSPIARRLINPQPGERYTLIEFEDRIEIRHTENKRNSFEFSDSNVLPCICRNIRYEKGNRFPTEIFVVKNAGDPIVRILKRNSKK